MLISLLKKPAPTGLVANAKLKFNRLKWNHVHDKNEHRYYVVYAYSNLTDLNNDTNGVAIERVFENRFKDDRESLNKGDFCGYRVSEVDIYDNESYKTGPVNVTFAHVGDTDVDHTSPGLPTSLSVTFASIERDADGTIVSNSVASWAAPASGIPVKYYLVKVTQTSNSESVVYKTDATAMLFRVKAGVQYDVQVKSVNLFNDPSAYTTAVSYTRPKKVGDLPAPGTVVATPGKKRALISWPQVNDDTYPDYRITYIYRSTTTTAPVPGTTTPYRKTKGDSILDEGLTTGQNYYYWVVHKDNSGNFSALSAILGPVTSGGNEVSTFSDLTGVVGSAQMGTGTAGNQLPNSDQSAGYGNWGLEYTTDAAQFITYIRTDQFTPHPGAIEIMQITGNAYQEYGVGPKNPDGTVMYFSVAGDEWYELSTYFHGHRCAGIQPYIKWETWNATTSVWDHLSYSAVGFATAFMGGSPLKNLKNYTRTPFQKVQAPSTAGRATVFFRHKGTQQGVGATNSYLWIHKMYFGQCEPNQTEATPWSPATPNLLANANIGAGQVTDDKVTQVAPTAPNTLSVTFGSIEIDDDGKSVANVVASWAQPATAIPVGEYIVRVVQNSTGEVRIFKTENLSVTFDVKTNKQYDVQVRSVSIFEKKSAYTGLVSYTRPKKSALPTAPTGVSIVQKANGNMVKWTAPADKDVAYYNVYVGTTNVDASATKVDSTFATYYLDQTVRTVGTNYYYFVTSVDRSGNESSTRVAASNNPQTYRQTVTAEIGTNQVTTTQVAPAAITPNEIQSKAVMSSKIYSFGYGNFMPDYELAERSAWRFSDGPTSNATLDHTELPPANAVASPNPTTDDRGTSDFKYRLTATLATNYMAIRSSMMPVVPGEEYQFSFILENMAAPESVSVGRNGFNGFIYWYELDATGTAVEVGGVSSMDFNMTSMFLYAGLKYKLAAALVVPAGAVFAVMHINISPDTDGVLHPPIDMIFASPAAKLLIPKGDVNSVVQEINAASTGAFGTGARKLAEVTVPFSVRVPSYRRITCQFKNVSGATKNFNFELRTNVPPYGGTPAAQQTRNNQRVGDDGTFTYTFFILAPDNNELRYSIYYIGTTSGNNVSQAEITVETIFC